MICSYTPDALQSPCGAPADWLNLGRRRWRCSAHAPEDVDELQDWESVDELEACALCEDHFPKKDMHACAESVPCSALYCDDCWPTNDDCPNCESAREDQREANTRY